MRLAGVLVGLVLLAGCASGAVEPAFEIPEGRSVVVLPFGDPDFPNGFESPRGSDVADRVTRQFRNAGEFLVRSPELRLSQATSVFEKDNRGALRDLAEAIRADYVLVGRIERWDLGNASTSSKLYQGESLVKLTLYEAPHDGGDGRFAFKDRAVKAKFPQDSADVDLTLEQIEDGLVKATVQHVAWVLVPHEESPSSDR